MRALSLLAQPEDRRNAWTAAVEQAGAEEEIPAGLVSRVVRDLVAKGAERRSKPRADQTEVMTYRITAKKLKKIRVFLGLIRAASGNSRGHIGIGKYVETIDELLPG